MAQQESSDSVFTGSSSNLQYLSSIKTWLLDGIDFGELRLRSDCHWSARTLVLAAVFWAWSSPVSLLDRFQLAHRIVSKLFRNRDMPRQSYQAFIKLLRRHSSALVPLLVARLRQRMSDDLSQHFLINGRAVFAVDGTKVLLPKTKSNELAYAKTRKRKQTRTDVGATTESGHLRNKVPQFYMTVLFNLGTQLLWDWRAGPSNASEAEHLEEMIGSLPANSIVVADAGFIGYDLWSQVFEAGHDWVVRVGANVKLLRKLGFSRENKSTVYYWPNEKRQKGELPMVFRLLRIDGGKHPVYLITNLKHAELTNRELSDLYRRRWGIEVYYRTLKCVYGRSKLRSGNAANARCELDWSMIGLWSAGALALYETGIDPPRLSMAGVIRAIRITLIHYRVRPEDDEDLLTNLRTSLIDTYKRKSKAPRNPTILTRNYRASRKPNIVNANKQQIRKAKRVKERIRLTA